MKPLNLGMLLCIFMFYGQQLSAQDKLNIKFGKITPQDFDLSKRQFDSSAAAVVIADIGNSVFEGNMKSGFSLIFTHHMRAKIINKNGMDIATVEIPLYSSGKDEEKLQNLKAVTYNLENGKVVETKLDDKSVFTDKAAKKFVIKKFTFPAVKEGSIIEFSYTQSSDFLFNLQPWQFQSEYPKLWSEYEVTIPEYFHYVTLTQGYQAFTSRTSNSIPVHYTIGFSNGAEKNENVTLDGLATDTRYVIKNVPALKEESFTTTLANHVSKIEFQLSGIQYPNSIYKDIMGNWPKLNEDMMEDEKFGVDINHNNGWLSDDLKTITNGATTKAEKAKKIFAYVRDNFTCTGHSSIYMENNLKTVFKNKNGNEAELNLLLVAMMNHEDIPSNPIILSTRHHGKTNEIYPLLDRFNYVVCGSTIDGAVYYLDASMPKLGFGFLPPYCYNGHARIVSKELQPPVYFDVDSLKEQEMTSVFIINDEKKDGVIDGSFQKQLGNVESYNIREKLNKKSEKDYFKEVKFPNSTDVEIANGGIDSLKLNEYPVTIHYDFTCKNMFGDDIVYFNPMLNEGYKENPFKAAERHYPVEMPYTTDETYVFNMEVPKGYVVDELPKSTKVSLNETDGFFEYLVVKDDTNIQLRSRIKLNKANFSPEDYSSLRDFYGFIVKKQSEQIVFKKKK
jgi:transglutaminase-like putative cysteine protease